MCPSSLVPYETKELAVDLTLSNIFSRSYLGGAAVDDFKTSRNARPTKPCTTRKGLQSPGPQLHALGPHNHGRHGPRGIVVHVLPNQDIYKRLAATEKANHQPIWRAQRRQLEAHAHAQALLYRNSATALDQLSIHPAAAQSNNGARRYEARKNFTGRR